MLHAEERRIRGGAPRQPHGVCKVDAFAPHTRRATAWRGCFTKVTPPDGTVVEREFLQQKHPVSTAEVQSWLEAHGFATTRLCGDNSGGPHTSASERAVFWAQRNQLWPPQRPLEQ